MVAKIVNSMVTEITGDLKKVRSHEPREAAFCGLSWQKNSRRCVSSPWDIGGRGMRRNAEGGFRRSNRELAREPRGGSWCAFACDQARVTSGERCSGCADVKRARGQNDTSRWWWVNPEGSCWRLNRKATNQSSCVEILNKDLPRESRRGLRTKSASCC
jgi:hypothetical protein